jgi:hypothetical protein
MWKSIGLRPPFARTRFVEPRFLMKASKFAASASCSPPIDSESSTTKSTSAVEMFESATRPILAGRRSVRPG